MGGGNPFSQRGNRLAACFGASRRRGNGGGVWAQARDEVECKLWTAGGGDGAAGTRSRSERPWSGEEW